MQNNHIASVTLYGAPRTTSQARPESSSSTHWTSNPKEPAAHSGLSWIQYLFDWTEHRAAPARLLTQNHNIILAWLGCYLLNIKTTRGDDDPEEPRTYAWHQSRAHCFPSGSLDLLFQSNTPSRPNYTSTVQWWYWWWWLWNSAVMGICGSGAADWPGEKKSASSKSPNFLFPSWIVDGDSLARKYFGWYVSISKISNSSQYLTLHYTWWWDDRLTKYIVQQISTSLRSAAKRICGANMTPTENYNGQTLWTNSGSTQWKHATTALPARPEPTVFSLT